MSAFLTLVLVWMVAVALLAHYHIAWYPHAWGAATLCASLPTLLALELSAESMTGFLPFSAFVSIIYAAAIGGAAGIPFYVWRRFRHIEMARVDIPRGMTWAMLAGMLAGASVPLLPAIAWTRGMDPLETLIFAAIVLGIVGTLVAAFAGTLFLKAAALGGHHPVRHRRQDFRLGAALGFTVALPMVVIPFLLPEEWKAHSANVVIALELNLALLLPAIIGFLWGRWAACTQAGKAAGGQG